MKLNLRLLLAIALLSFSTKGFAQDTNFYIFLCFGQSNMEGSAPIEEQDRTVDDRFQVLMANIIKAYGGNPCTHLVETAKQARKDGVIKGILCTRASRTPTTRNGRARSVYWARCLN
jgi:hypothetical protein